MLLIGCYKVLRALHALPATHLGILVDASNLLELRIKLFLSFVYIPVFNIQIHPCRLSSDESPLINIWIGHIFLWYTGGWCFVRKS